MVALSAISHDLERQLCNLPVDSTDICKARIHSNMMINLVKNALPIVRDEIHFVKEVKALNIDRRWKWFLVVVDQPGRDVGVVPRRWDAFRWKHHVDVQGCKDSKILVGVLLGVDEETPPLSCGNANVLGSDIFWFDVYTINLNGSEGMAIKIDCVTRKVPNINNVDKIGLAGFDRDRDVLAVIDEAAIGIRFQSTSEILIGVRLIVIEKIWHLRMVPV